MARHDAKISVCWNQISSKRGAVGRLLLLNTDIPVMKEVKNIFQLIKGEGAFASSARYGTT